MLKGSLDGFALPELFRLMSQSKKTGRLDVTRSAGRGQVYFREGLIYHATSSLSTAPLGRKLVELGALTERGLAKALDQHAVTGERVGEILLQNGVISEDQLEAAVRLQIEDAVFDLMRWDLGEFSWQPGVAVATEVPVRLQVGELVVEASRRIDELEVIQAKVPSPDAVMTLSPEAPRAHARVSMTPAEWKVLVLVDGLRTVAEIAELAQVENEVAMQMLHGLTSAGLIELAHPSGARGRMLRAAPPSQAPPTGQPLSGLLDDRPPYDLVGGPGPEPEGDGSEYFLKTAPEEPEPDDSAGDPEPDDSAGDPEPVLEEASGWPEGRSPRALDDWFSDSGTTFEGFDLPAPGELVTEEPVDVPAPERVVEDDVLDHAAFDSGGLEPSDRDLGESLPAETNGLLTSAPADGAEALLASSESPDGDPLEGRARKRVEDDERVTKGLINRLIEGLKGL